MKRRYEGISMDRLDYAILDLLLNKCEATTKMTAVSRKVILSEMMINDKTLYRRLATLIGKGFVSKGIMDIREHTYFITDDGKKELYKEVTE